MARQDQQRLLATEAPRNRAELVSRSFPVRLEKRMALALLPKATKTEADYEIDDAHPSSSFMTREQGLPTHDEMGGLCGCQREK